MAKKQNLWGKIILALLSLAGLFSLYQMLFGLWMTAYPFVNNDLWRVRVFLWLAATVLIGALWCGLLFWLVRKGRISN
jgi:hypothetical protein